MLIMIKIKLIYCCIYKDEISWLSYKSVYDIYRCYYCIIIGNRVLFFILIFLYDEGNFGDCEGYFFRIFIYFCFCSIRELITLIDDR